MASRVLAPGHAHYFDAYYWGADHWILGLSSHGGFYRLVDEYLDANGFTGMEVNSEIFGDKQALIAHLQGPNVDRRAGDYILARLA